jgi:hypothetical protein
MDLKERKFSTAVKREMKKGIKEFTVYTEGKAKRHKKLLEKRC